MAMRKSSTPFDPFDADFDDLTPDERRWRDELDLIDPIFGDANEIVSHAKKAPRPAWKAWLLLSLGELSISGDGER